jgi:hypothetical protein
MYPSIQSISQRTTIQRGRQNVYEETFCLHINSQTKEETPKEDCSSWNREPRVHPDLRVKLIAATLGGAVTCARLLQMTQQDKTYQCNDDDAECEVCGTKENLTVELYGSLSMCVCQEHKCPVPEDDDEEEDSFICQSCEKTITDFLCDSVCHCIVCDKIHACAECSCGWTIRERRFCSTACEEKMPDWETDSDED